MRALCLGILLLCVPVAALAKERHAPPKPRTFEEFSILEIAQVFDTTPSDDMAQVAVACWKAHVESLGAGIKLLKARSGELKLTASEKRNLRRIIATSPEHSRTCLAVTSYMAGVEKQRGDGEESVAMKRINAQPIE